MWAQLLKFRLTKDDEVRMRQLDDKWNEDVGRGSDSGWLRTITLRNSKDPEEWYELVFFESEAKARSNEQTPRHQELVKEMMDVATSVDFVDMTPVREESR